MGFGFGLSTQPNNLDFKPGITLTNLKHWAPSWARIKLAQQINSLETHEEEHRILGVLAGKLSRFRFGVKTQPKTFIQKPKWISRSKDLSLTKMEWCYRRDQQEKSLKLTVTTGKFKNCIFPQWFCIHTIPKCLKTPLSNLTQFYNGLRCLT